MNMKQKLLTLTAACAVLLATSCSKKMDNSENPFMQDYTTKYEIPPFDQIKYEHYIPAIKAGIEERNQEIAAITNNRAMPDFDNTILALDNSGKLLTKVSYVFYALSESDNTPEMEKISEEAMPLLTAAADEFSMNEMLFERIKQYSRCRLISNITNYSAHTVTSECVVYLNDLTLYPVIICFVSAQNSIFIIAHFSR